MSDILARIVESKKTEVGRLAREASNLRRRAEDAPPPRDLMAAFRVPDRVGLMAEVKRRSPGAGPIRPDLVPHELAGSYEAGGAGAVSVLTDGPFFGGSLSDLAQVKAAVALPVFRKDFIIHESQVFQAREAGADGVLLIARILEDGILADLHALISELGMTPLVEVHGPDEVDGALRAGAVLLGVNNRDLSTFQTSLQVTLDLLPQLPPHVRVVSESGIRVAEDVDRLGRAGVHGVLVGETLLRAPDPGEKTRELAHRPRVEQTREERM